MFFAQLANYGQRLPGPVRFIVPQSFQVLVGKYALLSLNLQFFQKRPGCLDKVR